MLKKIYRLSSARLQKARSISAPTFNLKTSENTIGFPRFAFAISKKIDRRATVRNSIKRKLSLSIEQIFDRINAERDFVFYPRPEIVNLSQKQISEEVQAVFTKEGFIK
jgi:ribonuclease P protein component